MRQNERTETCLYFTEEIGSSCDTSLKALIEEDIQVNKSCPGKHDGLEEDETDMAPWLSFDRRNEVLQVDDREERIRMKHERKEQPIA